MRLKIIFVIYNILLHIFVLFYLLRFHSNFEIEKLIDYYIQSNFHEHYFSVTTEK